DQDQTSESPAKTDFPMSEIRRNLESLVLRVTSIVLVSAKSGTGGPWEAEILYVDRPFSPAKAIHLCGDVFADSDPRDAGGVYDAHRYFPEYRYSGAQRGVRVSGTFGRGHLPAAGRHLRARTYRHRQRCRAHRIAILERARRHQDFFLSQRAHRYGHGASHGDRAIRTQAGSSGDNS